MLVNRFAELDATENQRKEVGIYLLQRIQQKGTDPRILLPIISRLDDKTRSGLAEELFNYYGKHLDSWEHIPAFAESILALDSPGFESMLAGDLLLRLNDFPPTSSDAHAAFYSLLPIIPDSKLTVVTDAVKDLFGVNYGVYLTSRPELLSSNKAFTIAKILIDESPQSLDNDFALALRKLSGDQASELAELIVGRFEAGMKEGAAELAGTIEVLAPKLVKSKSQELAERCLALIEGKDTRIAHVNTVLSHLELSAAQRQKALSIYVRRLPQNTESMEWPTIDDIASLQPSQDSEAASRARALAIPLFNGSAYQAETHIATFMKLQPTQKDIQNTSIVTISRMNEASSWDLPKYANVLRSIGAGSKEIAEAINIALKEVRNSDEFIHDNTPVKAIQILGGSRMYEALEFVTSSAARHRKRADSLSDYVQFMPSLSQDEQIRLSEIISEALGEDDDSAKHFVNFLVSFDKLPVSNVIEFLKLPAVSGQLENPLLKTLQARLAEKWPSTTDDAPTFGNSPWEMLEWMKRNREFLKDQFQIDDLDRLLSSSPMPSLY